MAGAAGLLVACLTLAACGGHPSTRPAAASCRATIVQALGQVAERTYQETVASEATKTAVRFVAEDEALSRAVAHSNVRLTRAVVEGLVKTGHIAAMRVTRHGKVLADLGVSPALTAISGQVLGPHKHPVGRYVISTTGDRAYIANMQSLISGFLRIASPAKVLEGTPSGTPPPKLPHNGTVTLHGQTFSVYSFTAEGYPSGPITISIIHSRYGDRKLCGASRQQTVANAIGSVGQQLYKEEAQGRETFLQLERASHDKALLRAVRRNRVHAAEVAIDNHLLNQHIVRVRVLRKGHLMADIGGPHVLAPVRAKLKGPKGHLLGSIEISIQDDLGYLLLVHRLLGAQVIMWRGPTQVISSLGDALVSTPDSGPFVYGGQNYTVFTFEGQAFPSGPLRIALLIPNPYM